MSESTSTILASINDWLLVRNPELDEIGPDVDLIENRIVDSLKLVEFIIFLEKVSGKPIDVDGLEVGDFRTLRSIEENLLGAE